jgi:hypothetical protein
MQPWLYTFFTQSLGKRLQERDGRSLKMPTEYTVGSFWVQQQDPTFSLAFKGITTSIQSLFMPRIFLWLPHFLVKTVACPKCGKELEKNGIAAPRRIVDIDSCFWLLTWRYQCRPCATHFQGWSTDLLETLPRYIRLAFPAFLSYRSGISTALTQLLRTCYQHKMGAASIRALLLEMHTRKFDQRCTQYLEAGLEVELRNRSVIEAQSTTGRRQTSLNDTFGYPDPKMPFLGSFWDTNGYAGFVPSTSYLIDVYNKLVDASCPPADQHTSLLPVDQISIDDSHKVCVLLLLI